jgi:hypothetical protein
MKNGWLKVDYDNPPKGDVLLLTSSKVIVKGDYWKNQIGEYGFRTEQSEWRFSPPDGNEYVTVLKPVDIVAYQPLPSTEIE